MLNQQPQSCIGETEEHGTYGQFGYLFETASPTTDDWMRLAGLDALAVAMSRDSDWFEEPDTDVWRFGRFVFDNLVHVLDLNNALRRVFDDELAPMSRFMVAMTFANEFTGSIGEGISRSQRLRTNADLGVLPPLGSKRLIPDRQAAHQHNCAGSTERAEQLWWACQKLILTRFLPKILDPSVLDWINKNGTPLYDSFLKKQDSYRMGDSLPLPVELVFSVLPALNLVSFNNAIPAVADRIADDVRGKTRSRTSSAKRLLRTGHLLSMPSANHCIQDLNRGLGVNLATLTGADLCSGRCAEAVHFGSMESDVPLGYYCIRETSWQADRQLRLGPLASHLVGQTLVGLIKADPNGFWGDIPQQEKTRKPKSLVLGANSESLSLSDFLRLVEAA